MKGKKNIKNLFDEFVNFNYQSSNSIGYLL